MMEIVADRTSQKATLAISTMAAFILTFMSSSVNIALPAISQEFSLNAVMTGWMASAFSLGSAALLVPFGRLADIIGRKKILLVGMLLFAISSFLATIVRVDYLLILLRGIQGISTGMTAGTSVAIITSVFPPKSRGKALGINVAATYVGLSIGPFLGGLLTENLGWQSVFFFSAFWGLAVVVLIMAFLKGEWAEAKHERFDVAGSVALTLFIVLVIYGLIEMPSLTGIIAVAIGLISVLIFIWWEKKTSSPVMDLNLFRSNRTFVLSNIAVLITYSGGAGLQFPVEPLYAIYQGDVTSVCRADFDCFSYCDGNLFSAGRQVFRQG
jgi:MFS family permease